MTISSRTPEGPPHRCPVCQKIAPLEPSYPAGDSVCPSCGQLLWLIRTKASEKLGLSFDELDLDSLLQDDAGVDSLELVELMMDIESETTIQIPEDVAAEFRTIRDVIEYLRRIQEEE